MAQSLVFSSSDIQTLSGVEGDAFWYGSKMATELSQHVAASLVHDPQVDEATADVPVGGREGGREREGERGRGHEIFDKGSEFV